MLEVPLPSVTAVRLLAVESVRVPTPSLTKVPLETVFAKVTAEATARVREAPPRSTVPLIVSAPVLVPSPSVALPPKTRLLASVRAVVESLESAPPESVTAPEPRAELLPTRRVPDARDVPPA